MIQMIIVAPHRGFPHIINGFALTNYRPSDNIGFIGEEVRVRLITPDGDPNRVRALIVDIVIDMVPNPRGMTEQGRLQFFKLMEILYYRLSRQKEKRRIESEHRRGS